ncbi:MAG: glycerol kinase GlpK [Actinomycetota bacterium]|nr:glycerol kinase GlpK [Actinomycetota bacterium]MEC8923929.1 glycerol kinase GlpK [Actinomycetota bacterium]MEC9338803.1 glycerol kinase GlpK [Actinomycetota bacterium]
MAVVVSIDAGTTGVRSFALNDNGEQVALAYQEFEQHYPRPGWVEHDATEIWRSVQITLSELMTAVEEPVAAVGIANQRETIVAWSRASSEPLSRAIVWQDLRTSDRCEQLLEAEQLDQIRKVTGLVINPYFSGTKIEWLLKNGGVESGPDLAFGTIDSWLIWKLTGGATHVTDVTNASRTLLFDINKGCWADELCDLLGVPGTSLPEVLPSSGRFGTTADTTALGRGIPISGVAGDQQSALFGQACFEPGMTKNTYGTGSFVLMNVGTACPEPVDGLLTTVAWDLGDGPVFALEGSVFVTGAAIQWLRDGLEIISDASEIGHLAESASGTGGVFFVPAFAGLGSPWWDPRARGTIIGITGGTGRAEIALAVVEAMAFQTRDVVDAMAQAGGMPVSEMRVDGGAAVLDLLLQIQADQLGVRVARPVVTETTAQGAAMLAGLAEGIWANTQEISAAWRLDRSFEPRDNRSESDALHQDWLRALARSRDWATAE